MIWARCVGTVVLGLLVLAPGLAAAGEGEKPRDIVYRATPPAPRAQPQAEADRKSAGCLSCHIRTDQPTMHVNPVVVLSCTDCHGGDATVTRPAAANSGGQPGPRLGSGRQSGAEEAHGPSPYAADCPAPLDDAGYRAALDAAHVQPRYPETWHYPYSRNPENSFALLNLESPEFVRFVNPSDYRVAREACGACHLPIIQASERHLMSTGAMFWGGGAYNNGILPFKNYILGEAYTREGEAAIIKGPGEASAKLKAKGILPQLVPLPAFEVVPPGDIFRVFERGGRNILNLFPEIGLPNPLGNIQRLEEPGRPDLRQSNRGPGTGLRIAVPVLNIHKTRLNDPFMWFLGTNDNPGDYRSSGCAGCHVVYANDRDPRHSGPYAKFGHDGRTQTVDPTIPRDEPGHPIAHEFSRAIPTSQCMICHMHQPNVFVNSYLGYTMWDYEADAPFMWPKEQRYPTPAEIRAINQRNPEEAAIRGLWSDPEFLETVASLNPKLKNTQFADYHGHGWNFRAVFKKDRKGNLLDAEGTIVPHDDPDKFDKAVHMASIHLDKGMHCVDCHFAQDAHGSGYIYGEVADAIEIDCADCHGTANRYPDLSTSGPASSGRFDMSLLRLADGRRRFEWRGDTLIQRSALWPDLEWEMSLVKDSVDPGHRSYNAKAARAKLMSKGTSFAWGPGVSAEQRAHDDDEMYCFTCHVSWTTSCAGCHLPIQANWKTPMVRYEGRVSRNYATYNPQVVRDQMFQLGRHSTVKKGKIAPVRSSSALVLSSQNINRERLYVQQPPISASGFSSQAFAPHFPHTVRKTETKTCTDCHLSEENDNNAIMAQLLLQGTNFVNFVGANAWIGGDGGVAAVRVTEWDEPQAVIGSYLHKYAYPDWYGAHLARGRELTEAYQPVEKGAIDRVSLDGET